MNTYQKDAVFEKLRLNWHKLSESQKKTINKIALAIPSQKEKKHQEVQQLDFYKWMDSSGLGIVHGAEEGR